MTPRIFYSAIVVTGCYLATASASPTSDCGGHLSRLIYEKPGDVTVTGIFDGTTGDNCSRTSEFGAGDMAAALWTVTALDRLNYLPGMTVGLSLFDACSSQRGTTEAFAESVLLDSCRNGSSIGTITTPGIHGRVSGYAGKLNRTVTRLDDVLNLNGLVTVIAELLVNLHWTSVTRVIGDTSHALSLFTRRMSEEGVCVYESVLADNVRSVYKDLGENDDLPVVIVLSRSEQIRAMFRGMTAGMRAMRAKWLIAPTDFVLDAPLSDLPDDAIAVLPLVDKPELLLRFDDILRDHMNHREATRSPLFVRTAVAIIRLVERVKNGLTSSPPPKTVPVTTKAIADALAVLGMDDDNEAFMFTARPIRSDDDAAIFQVFDPKTRVRKPTLLILNDGLFGENDGRRRSCSDADDDDSGKTNATCGWCHPFPRLRTWIVATASVAAVGILCTVSVIVFIIVRVCKGDILEGSPFFSFLILVAIVLTYSANVPFGLDPSPLVCHLRVLAPTIVYPLLFSVILSRSAMIVFAERDAAIANHVSGPLQILLCFFVCLVQVSLTVQLCLYRIVDSHNACEIITLGHPFILLLSYSFFLLFLLVLTTPLTITSKRNYREGAFFCASTVLFVAVWSGWLTVFHVLPGERDAAICLGLTGTATSVLVAVFVPRTYLMATSRVRDKIANALPNLAYIHSSNISELNYRGGGVVDSDDMPGGPGSSPRMLVLDESTIDAAETCESPEMTGKITRF